MAGGLTATVGSSPLPGEMEPAAVQAPGARSSPVDEHLADRSGRLIKTAGDGRPDRGR